MDQQSEGLEIESAAGTEYMDESDNTSANNGNNPERVQEPGGLDESSDSGESDDDGETEKLLEQAASFEIQIRENPYLYDTYKELISIYKTLGELEQLREVRKKFSQAYPLTAELWLDWLNDERALVSTDEDKMLLVDLFELAVQDYASLCRRCIGKVFDFPDTYPVYAACIASSCNTSATPDSTTSCNSDTSGTQESSARHQQEILWKSLLSHVFLAVELWLEYCAFVIGLGDRDRCIDIMSRAIEEIGSHLTDGKLVRDLVIEYEMAVLGALQPAPGSCPSNECQEKISLQTKRVDQLFKQLVTTPLVGINSALAEYETWLGEQVADEVRQAHQKALDILKSCNQFENDLASAQTNESKAEVYTKYLRSYINHHPKNTDSIKCLFERAIVSNCLDQNIWIQYATYLEKNMSDKPETIMSVYKRAVRNCPWSSSLWVSYCLAAEKQHAPLEELEDRMETALQSGLSTSFDFLSVWSAYCDVIRRKIDWSNADATLLEKLRAVFERAIHQLLKYYGEAGDTECSLPKYWALIEAKYCNNMEKAREIWNESLVGYRNSQAAAWLEYAAFERCYGDHKHCRRIYQRALKSVADWPESICSEYIKFEREEGTLDQLYIAQSRVAEVREQIAKNEKFNKSKFEKRQQMKDSNKTSGRFGKDRDKKPVSKEKTNPNKEPVAFKRKRSDAQNTDENNSFKKPKVPAGGGDNSGKDFEFKVPSLPTTEKSVLPAEEPNKSEDKPDYKTTDDRTAFVSNLSYHVDETKLMNIFQQCGTVKEVRIMKGKGDKSKGFAYVEFVDSNSAVSALKLDRTEVDSRPMYVSPCNAKRTENQPLKYDTGLEKCKLFVSGLSFKTTKEQLEQEFSKHGKVKDTRIVTYKNGKSKGLAYVEFNNETDARQALLAMDGSAINNFNIKVAISNPPPRKTPTTQRTESKFVPSLGGASRQVSESQPRGKARTQLNLMPRSLQTKPITQKTTPKDSSVPKNVDEKPEESAPPTKGKMSNSDFRTMLLNKK